MKILRVYPPNYLDIIKALPWVKGKNGIVYAWGDILYNPSMAHITPWLEAHEGVHGERQGAEILQWWDRYLTDPQWRLEEEIPAHRAEWKRYRKVTGSQAMKTRYLRKIADRLSGPLYGNLIDLPGAIKEINQ